MTNRAPLRMVLHKLPAFSSLSAAERDRLSRQMVRREYRSGETLWRAGTPPDRLAIIERGEVVVEYRYRGVNVRTVTLGPGEIIEPGRLKEKQALTRPCLRAATDTALYALPAEAAGKAPSSSAPQEANRFIALLQRLAWPVLVTALILALSWNDLTRILSTSLFLASDRAAEYGREPIQLLGYAEQVDRGALFAYNQQGYLLFQDGDLLNAEAAFLEAATQDVANAPALNNLAITYYRRGEVPQATELQQRAVQGNPNHATLQYNLGLLLMEQNARQDAIRAFDEASRIDPAWALPYLQKGFLYLKMQDYMRAEQAARAAIQRDPTQESAHLILTVALYNQGRYVSAQEAVREALRLNPNDDIARFYQALLTGRLGDAASAIMYLQELRRSAEDPQTVARIDAEIESFTRSLQDGAP